MSLMLTAGRRFPFSASRRLSRPGWSAERNEEIYGAGRERDWGRGENFEAYVILEGMPDPDTGMIVNLSAVKDAVREFLEIRYDHRFLNLDTPPYNKLPPTPENLARQLLAEARSACERLGVKPVVCHLRESPSTGATAYVSGVVERDFWLSFSAARQTCSPHLTEEENREVFGEAASPLGHGHGYKLRVVLRGLVDEGSGLIAPFVSSRDSLHALHGKLDHRHLNLEVPEWQGQPMTTECLARSIFNEMAGSLPVARVCLFETPEFFAEYDGTDASLGSTHSFSAAHCLRLPGRTEEENRRIFGKCSNANGHGHRYTVQTTVTGPLDERTGIVYHLGRFEETFSAVLSEFDQRHLDTELADFREHPSTGENIVGALWSRLAPALEVPTTRLRLWETENNRFTLRGR